MATAQSRGWGPPCQVPLVTLVRDDGLRLPVHRDVADLVSMLIDLTELQGYDVKPGQTWGYACRKISGTNVDSEHSWALPVDINAPANPYASAEWHRRNARGTFPFGLRVVCDIPESVLALWEAYGFRLGVKYKSKPDPMHVEFYDTPAAAARYTLALRNWIADNGQDPGPTPIPLPPEPEDDEPMLILIPEAGPDKDKAYLVGPGDTRRHLAPVESQGLRDAGVRQTWISAHGWQPIIDSTRVVTTPKP